MLEVLQRGPDMMKMLLEVQSPTVQFHHFYFHSAFYAMHSRERMEIYLEQYMEEDMDCTLRDDLAFLTCLNQKIREWAVKTMTIWLGLRLPQRVKVPTGERW